MQPRLLKEPVRLAGPALLARQSDERLVRLARDGHQPAFAAIVDRYRPALLRYCTRLVGEQRAEDAVQQSLVNAHRALTERETTVELQPWLYRIAHNAAVNTLRGETAGWSFDDPDAAGALTQTAGAAEGVEAAVVRREHLHDTLTAISALPRPQRDALLLRELEGRSHVEIGAALGVTAGAARQHLMRARAAVRAAATAITPYPLLVKVATWMTFTPTGERVTQVAVGTGLGAGVVKVTAGVLATGALVGGVVGSGAVPLLHDSRPLAAASSHAGRRGAVARVEDTSAASTAPRQAVSVPAGLVAGGSQAAGRERADAGAVRAPTRPARTPLATGVAGGRDGEHRAPAFPGGEDDGPSESASASGHGASGSGTSGSGSHHGSGSDDDGRTGAGGTSGESGSGSDAATGSGGSFDSNAASSGSDDTTSSSGSGSSSFGSGGSGSGGSGSGSGSSEDDVLGGSGGGGWSGGARESDADR